MKRLRGHRISMIFQEPMTSLNPVLTVGTQIAENVVRHLGVSWRAARERAREMLDLVRIADARRRLDEYPAPALGRHAPAGDDRHGARPAIRRC